MTGRDLISAQLRKINALAPGESIDAQEAMDGLAETNRMLSSWSNEGLLIYAITAESPIALTPGDATYTLGTSGDITTRPQKIEKAVIRDGSYDLSPMRILTLDEFSAIPNKSAQSTYPYSIYDDGGYPLRTITLYPVPSAAKQLVLFTKRPLTEIASLSTELSFPPGYEDALVYNGAIRLAPEYEKQVSAEVAKIASDALAGIKRANHRPALLRCDDAVVGCGGFDILTGGYR